MTTLSRYRACFDACGIVLPQGRLWAVRGRETLIMFGRSTDLLETEGICVCRCAAEDWLNARGLLHLCVPRAGVQKIFWEEFDPARDAIEHAKHARVFDRSGEVNTALIALCYAVAGKEEQA